MYELLKQIAENIPGIWVNQQYELILSLPPDNFFSFRDKTNNPETFISGNYYIVQPNEYYYPTLRLIESTGLNQDYVINELSAFGNLIITHEGEEIQLTNRLPD